MTVKEAYKVMKLKDSDTLNKAGIESLIKTLKTQRVANYERKQHNTELEALETLLKVAK